MRGGGSIAGITFGHVAGRGGDMRVRSWRYFGVGLMVRARIQGHLGKCAVGERAVGPAAVEVGVGGVWPGLLAVGSPVERGRA